MATEEASPERTRAYYKFREAEQQAVKHHYDQALQLAHDAVEIDPTYTEARFWIANIYRQQDKSRRASMIYQEILHLDREDQKAWAALREVDPMSAARLERLSEIAPDPFVAQRNGGNAVSEDLDDLAGLAGELTPEPEEEALLFTHDVVLDDLDDLSETGGVQNMLQAEVGSITGVQPAHGEGEEVAGDDLDADSEKPPAVAAPPPGPPAWLYEEDLTYRDKIKRIPVYEKLLPKIVDFWRDEGQWDTAISGSVHLDPQRHPGIVETCREVEQKLGTSKWNLYVCPERRMISTITRGDPPTLSLTTGCLNTLSHEELVFLVGRFTTMVTAGHVPYLQMLMMTLERSPRTITDVEIDMLELLHHYHSGWDAGVHREERMKLGQLCHAWQQRAELSADRGGLICCGDLDVACKAIARLAAPDSNAAPTATPEALAEKFKGQEVGQLAAIPPKEDPARNEGYALYRLKMLRWWAHTPAAQALLPQ